MTREEKQLVLQDVCARLPYGVKYRTIGAEFAYTLKWIDVINRLDGEVRLENAKIFLRPMSSMTEEEEEQWLWLTNDSGWGMTERMIKECVDFLNKNMLDYRGLIPKGLALEAPEGMYNI